MNGHVTAEQVQVARAAYRDFGRGSGHAAKLNFGDCFAYALAKCRDEPLLFKGDDFMHTDVVRVGLQDEGEDRRSGRRSWAGEGAARTSEGLGGVRPLRAAPVHR